MEYVTIDNFGSHNNHLCLKR